MQLPSHSTKSRPVCSITYRPKLRSGAKIIGCSGGIWLTILTALELVQIISLMALIAAVQLMYDTTIWSGCAALKRAKASGGQLSAREQPASKSGSKTNLSRLRILAVSAMKWTPANTITSASVSAAWRESPRESPI